MAIKIKTEKIVDGYGKKMRRIVRIDALRAEDLPELYLSEQPSVHYGDRCLHKSNGESLFSVGGFYKEKEFQERMEYLKEAGERLSMINRKLEAIEEEWNGRENFSI